MHVGGGGVTVPAAVAVGGGVVRFGRPAAPPPGPCAGPHVGSPGGGGRDRVRVVVVVVGSG